MPRKELKGILAVGVIVLLGAVLAARPDLAWLLFADTAGIPQSDRSNVAAELAPTAAKDGKAPTETRTALSSPQASPSQDRPKPAPGQGKPAEARDTITAKAAEPRSTPEAARTAVAESSKFDVVRIDPEGASVFAGRAPANARVTVLANGQPVATATANASGEWSSVIERSFPSGEVKLSLRTAPGGQGPETAGQSVQITIAARPSRPEPADTKVAAKARAVSAPSPITFVYDEDTLTEPGRKEIAALTEFLRQRRFETITLTGHADSRGSDEYNMELSRRRLESVTRFLRAAGYTGKVVLMPMGKREPFATAQREGMSKEDAFQLDRRVELRASP